jgi:diguanylate cyclase (GGDEF)-like protein
MFLDAFRKAIETRFVQELQYSLPIGGKERWFEARVADSTKETVISIVRDITERKEMEARLEQLAFYDPLTTLANRRLLLDRLSHAVAASNRTSQYGAAIFLDLDNFKPLNDLYGHEIGDSLLVEAALRLKRCVREMDTVGRFGGDEFVVLLVDLSGDLGSATSQARVVAEKIRLSLAEPYLLPLARTGHPNQEIDHRCGVSIGVAMFGNHTISDKDALRHADSAMYQAKGAGRNRLHFHN